MVLNVPMRNWNLKSGSQKVLRNIRVLNVPMRNWNPAEWSAWAGIRFCFERTYEELKPGVVAAAKEGKLSFERTYEELKLVREGKGMNLLECFERTYEELKPNVRNENWSAHGAFWTYLWGIETWRRAWISGIDICFERTYEELKLKPVWVHLTRISGVLNVPMRNWNSWQVHQSREFRPRFWTYLWGIETWSLQMRMWRLCGFERTYEELKHYSV